MATTSERVAKNEALFREVNERINEVSGSFFALDPNDLAEFVCECSQEGCHQAVSLTRIEYEEVRSEPRHFLVAPGHLWNPETERQVFGNERYWVLEKVARAGQVAVEDDPRE